MRFATPMLLFAATAIASSGCMTTSSLAVAKDARELVDRMPFLEIAPAPHKDLFGQHVVIKLVDRVAIRHLHGVSGPLATALRPEQAASRRQRGQRGGVGKKWQAEDLTELNQLLSEDNTVWFGPLFSRYGAALDRERTEAQALSGKRMADLSNYYLAVLGSTSEAIELVRRLRALKIVESAYFAPIPRNADIPPPTADFGVNQGYLAPAPAGIDAAAGWAVPGGDGAGIRIIDIEFGWLLDHEDLPLPFFTNIPVDVAVIPGGTAHGTAVLGVLVALDDNRGITGIANGSNYGVVSILRLGWVEMDNWLGHFANVADSINLAASELRAGDVLLIEQHAPPPNPLTGLNAACTCQCDSFGYLPVEYWQAEFDAITNATARGIIVIEPAGNGGQDLDDPAYNGRFNLVNRDSGAIMVGAGSVTADAAGLNATLGATCSTSHGSRVDVQAWGNGVFTLGTDAGAEIQTVANDNRQWYTSSFSGTSSASAIVAGVVASVQGTRIEAGQTPLAFLDMRNRLVSTGTPQTGTSLIGPQPDLAGALASLVNDPIVSDGTYSVAARQSTECGGLRCQQRTRRSCFDECFFFLCWEECLLVLLDEYECVAN